MAPSTRVIERLVTPPRRIKNRELNTVQKTSFYNAFDTRPADQSIRRFATANGYIYETARDLVNERKRIGPLAYRHSRARSNKLGRPCKISKTTCRKLLSPSNPKRYLPYNDSIAYFDIDACVRTIQRAMKEHTNHAQRYKMAMISGELKTVTKRKRVECGTAYEHDTVENFWQYVTFTNEVHVRMETTASGYVLRE